jgi:hypothetical protein
MVCKWYNVCPLRRLEEKGRIGDRWKREYCETERNWKNCKRYQMTERGEPHSDNMMPDGTLLK